jgi:hypothetical protein
MCRVRKRGSIADDFDCASEETALVWYFRAFQLFPFGIMACFVPPSIDFVV